MPAPRAIFFDAGGTLIYLDRRFLIERVAGHGIVIDNARFAAADRVATRHAVKLMRSGLATDDAGRWRAYGQRLLSELGLGADATTEIGQAIRERHEEGLLWSWVEPGTADTLAALRERGYTLLVVSNADGRVADFLERAGLASHFHAIIDSGAIGIEKPDPRIFRIACEHAGVAPHEAVHVGDILEIDVVGALAAGVRPILFDPHDAFTDVEYDRIAAIPALLDLFPATGLSAARTAGRGDTRATVGG